LRNVLFTKKFDLTEYKKNIRKFIDDWEIIKKRLKKYAHDLLLKGENKMAEDMNDTNMRITYAINLYNKYIIQREGEERVNRDVPLNSKYLQIRLLESILMSAYKNDQLLKKMIKQNNNLFIKNETYNNYMGSLREDTYFKRMIRNM
jgi:hypothetical protein